MLSEEDVEKLQGNYWKPEQGKMYRLKITNWRREETNYNEPSEPMKSVLVFDILEVDNMAFDKTTVKTFSSGAMSFLKKVVPILVEAQKCDMGKTVILLEYGDDKRYHVKDLSSEMVDKELVQQIIKK